MEGDLARAWKRSKKRIGWENDEAVAAEMRGTMAKFAPVPGDMAEELADFFLPGPVDEEAVYRSEEILEVLAGEWTPVDSALTDEDWEFLGDLVDAWAHELDMDIVTDVMRIIVDRGGFHGG